MHCPCCTAQNAPAARFCSECGGRLFMICAACGAEQPLASRFCNQCGMRMAGEALPPASPEAGVPAPLLPSGPAAPWSATQPGADGAEAGETRIATILFADISGSVALTRSLHPEDAQTLVNRLLTAMVDAIMEHGGEVNRLLGDGALGLFGTPRARETDPERAILAALRVRDAAQLLGMNVSVGINTGEVYFGGVGSERHRETTVIGAVVNLASRLQNHAGAGEILVGEATFRATAGMFRFAPQRVAVRGLDEVVAAYRVDGAQHSREKVRGLDGLRAPLIGREAELEAILGAVLASRSGAGNAVVVVGDAGVGKTRLLAEAQSRTATPPEAADPQTLWLEGRCYELGQSESYGPFIDLLRRYFHWSPLDVESERGARIRQSIGELVAGGHLDAADAETLAPYLGYLLSVSLGDPQGALAESTGSARIRNQTFAALRAFLLALADRQPLVLMLEDLHWADNLSLDFLAYLLESVTGSALTLLCAYRLIPEHRSGRIAGQAGQCCGDRFREVRLGELSPEQNRRLIGTLIGEDTLPATLRELVVRKSNGNPFYLEEVLRTLIDRGVLYRDTSGWHTREDLQFPEVPESIQNIILSRVDQLTADTKRILEDASVAGQAFRPRVLEEMGHTREPLQQALAILESHGLITRDGELLEEGYLFRHVLTRDTIYRTLLKRRRAGAHLKIAEALERIHAGHLDDRFDELAYHYVESGKADKALEFSLKAGRKAADLFANHEAVRYLESALELGGRLPASARDVRTEIELRELLGDVLFRLGAHGGAERHFEQALAAARRTEPAAVVARLSGKLADAVHWLGRTAEAIRLARAGLEALGADRGTAEGVNLLEIMIRSYWAMEDLDSARAHAADLERLLPEVPYFDHLYMIHYALVWLEVRSGNLDRAEQWLEAMRIICVEHDAANGLARCFHGFGDLARAREDLDAAAEWFQQSIALCERTGDAHLLVEGHLERAHALLKLGRPYEEIEPNLERGMKIAEEMASFGGVSSIQALYCALSYAYIDRGDDERAIFFLERFGYLHAPERLLPILRAAYERIGHPERFEEFCERVGLAADGSPACVTV